MKRLIYTLTYEHKTKNTYSIYGIAIREKATGALNAFFPVKLENDGDLTLLPIDALMHVQHLVTTYGAQIEWNLTPCAVYPN